MTRINCVPVEELTDQHLLAEYREITRVSKLARPLEDYGKYTMGQGHVKFFYDKGLYLLRRTNQLYAECTKRGFNVAPKAYISHPYGLNRDWEPGQADMAVNRQRIQDKLDLRPDFYRKNGKLFTSKGRKDISQPKADT